MKGKANMKDYEFKYLIELILQNDIKYMDFKIDIKVINTWYSYLKEKNVINDYRYMYGFTFSAVRNYFENGFIV